MADVELANMGDGGDRDDIFIGKPVTGMNFQAEIGAEFRRVSDMLQQSVALTARP